MARRNGVAMSQAYRWRDAFLERGKLAGVHSIRINDQFRIIFTWADGNAKRVEITDHH